MSENIFYLLFVTYGAILLSELVGDRSIYIIASLTMRFPPVSVFCGFTVAFMIKMLVAVLLGQVISKLPHTLVVLTSSATLVITALIIWFKNSEVRSSNDYESRISKGALIALLALLFSEWGDPGQIMAAMLTARYKLPLIVWLAGTLALITKGLLALALGRGLRQRIPLAFLRPVSAILCLVLAVVSALEQL